MTEPKLLAPTSPRSMGPLLLAGLLFAAAVGGGAVGAILATGTPEAEAATEDVVVQAQRFEVVDSSGKVRATLAMLPDGMSGLALFDAAGTPRANLLLSDKGTPSLSLDDAAGLERAALALAPFGDTPSLQMLDAAGGGGICGWC